MTDHTSGGRLGDTADRDYARKLPLCNAMPEPRAAIASLRLQPGVRVLDTGSGTGETLRWLAAVIAPNGLVVGVDLSARHLRTAQGLCRRTPR